MHNMVKQDNQREKATNQSLPTNKKGTCARRLGSSSLEMIFPAKMDRSMSQRLFIPITHSKTAYESKILMLEVENSSYIFYVKSNHLAHEVSTTAAVIAYHKQLSADITS